MKAYWLSTGNYPEAINILNHLPVNHIYTENSGEFHTPVTYKKNRKEILGRASSESMAQPVSFSCAASCAARNDILLGMSLQLLGPGGNFSFNRWIFIGIPTDFEPVFQIHAILLEVSKFKKTKTKKLGGFGDEFPMESI